MAQSFMCKELVLKQVVEKKHSIV